MDNPETIQQMHKLHANLNHADKKKLYAQLLYAEERRKEHCVLIQAGGFVIGGKAFLITGTGTINILESIAQFSDVEGIIGNGNALFISKDFTRIYSTLDEEETLYCYESRRTNRRMPYMYSAEIWPVIFLQRAFKNPFEHKQFKGSQRRVWFVNGDEFIREPLSFRSRYRSRLKNKFVKTCQVVHCCHRPTMQLKELLYDESKKICVVIENFIGQFILGYTLYNIDLEKVIGFYNFVKWRNNPSERMASITRMSCYYLLSRFQGYEIPYSFEPYQIKLSNI